MATLISMFVGMQLFGILGLFAMRFVFHALLRLIHRIPTKIRKLFWQPANKVSNFSEKGVSKMAKWIISIGAALAVVIGGVIFSKKRNK